MKHFLRLFLTMLLTVVWSMGGYAVDVEQSSFTATSATSIGGDTNLSYSTAKGYGTVAPAMSSSQIVLYQKSSSSSKYGGTITIKVKEGYALNSVTIGSAKATSIAYTIDSDTELSTTSSLSANGKFKVDNINATSITFYCMGTAKGSRTYVNYLGVTYEELNSNLKKTTLSFTNPSYTFTSDNCSSFTGQTPVLMSEGAEVKGKSFTFSKTGDDIFSTFNEDGTLSLNGNGGKATITAKFAGDDTYASSTASYTITVLKTYESFADLKKVLTNTESEYLLKLTDAVVSYTNDKSVYMEDATTGLLVYYADASNSFKAGQKLNGYVNVKANTYYNLPEVTSWTPTDTYTVVEGAEIPLTTVTIADLNDNYDKYESRRLKVENATVTTATTGIKQSGKISQNGSDITLRTNADITTTKDDVIDVIGFLGIYNTGKQFNVWSQDDVTVKASVVATTLSFDTDETSFTVKKTKESAFVSPKATVKDADNNVVEGAAVKYVSSTPAVATVAEDGTVTLIACGTTTITASYAGDATHKAAKSVSYTINYVKVPTEMAFSAADVTVNLGEEDKFVAPTLTLTADGESILDGKTVTYESSNEDVAAFVNGNIVFGNIEGTATITASYAGDDTYDECSASYTLNVVDPNKSEVTFDFVNNRYGYDKKAPIPEGGTIKSGNITITNVKNGTLNNTAFFDDNLRIYNGSQTSFEASYGYVITKISATFDKNNFTSSNVTWSAGSVTSDGAWTGKTRKVTITSNNSIQISTLTVTYAKCQSVTFDEDATDEGFMNLVIAGNEEEVSATLTRTMEADGGWYTFSAPFSVADINESPLAGAELRKYSSMSVSTMNFEATTEIKAGHAYLIKPTKNIENPVFDNVVLDLGDTKVDGENGYKFEATLGVHEMETDGTELFLGAENKFYKPTETDKTLKALRGYFVVPEGTSPSKMNISIDGETTSIAGLHLNGNVSGKVYNLNGQYVGNDVKQLGKGIYVVNGKKYIVK